MEIWKTNNEYPNYEISDLGRVRHIKYKKFRKLQTKTGKEYLVLRLKNKDSRLKDLLIHRLVAITFLGDHKNLVVDHINNNPKDNRLVNLRWISQEENIDRSKITEILINKIIELYKKDLTIKEIKEKLV